MKQHGPEMDKPGETITYGIMFANVNPAPTRWQRFVAWLLRRPVAGTLFPTAGPKP